MAHAFTIEPSTYYAFDTEAAQIKQCKEWGLLSEKAVKTKTFFYKGNGMNMACTIVGFVDKMTAVIEFEDNERHCIHPAYLKEMQAANYGQKPAIAAEEATEPGTADPERAESQDAAEEIASPDTREPAAAAPASDEPGIREPVAAEAETADPSLSEPVGHEPENAEPERLDMKAASEAEALPAGEAANEEPAAEQPAKGKAKRGKAEKLQLPEEKVKMTATVQEFTTVPNNFSDNDDEVVIYEAVSILEPATDIGTAWSSHSATLKKLELAIGDTITFEAKIIAKKLTKHPVPYKINNPAKIQKQS